MALVPASGSVSALVLVAWTKTLTFSITFKPEEIGF